MLSALTTGAALTAASLCIARYLGCRRPRLLAASLAVASAALAEIALLAVRPRIAELDGGPPLWTILRLLGYAALTVGFALETIRAQRRGLEAEAALAADRRHLERERHERDRLERSQRSLQTAVETLRLGVTVTDLDNRIRYVNPADAEMHGYDRDHLIGRDARIYGYGDAGDPDDAGPPPARFWDRESVNARADGSRFPVRLISDVVRNSEGEPIGMLTICEDLSEKRAAERVQEDFIASVSHELRTPLTSIVAALDMLEPVAEEPPRRSAEMMEIAHRNSRRLLRLIDDLLVLQKLRTGRVDFRLEPLDVRPLLESAIADFRPQAGARSIELRLADDVEDARVLADRDRLLQVLSNLLSNAVKYSAGSGRRVELGVSPAGGRVTISVTDDGPGIPEEDLDQLFEPFRRATSRSGEEGTGLGLSIVKRLVQGMHGAVTVDSRVDHGTTVQVILPAATASSTVI